MEHGRNPLVVLFSLSFMAISCIPFMEGAMSEEVQVLIVDPEGPGYRTILDAYNFSSEGDTILVKPGIYAENLDIKKGITIGHAGGRGEVVIDGSARGPGIRLSAPGITVKGLTVTNATSGLSFRSSQCAVIDCTLTGNLYGAFMNNCEVNTLSGCTLDGNRGAGIAMMNASWNSIINCSTDGNGEMGISFFNSWGNRFQNGTSSGNGRYGAYLYWFSDLNTFQGYDCSLNGLSGFYIFDVSGNHIDSCRGDQNGEDGVYIMGSENIVRNSWFEGNEGCGARFYHSNGTSMINCTLKGNGDHGAFLRFSSSNKVSLSRFIDNGMGIQTVKGSDYNLFYLNDMISNDTVRPLARDDGANLWNSGLLGNFWSDAVSMDVDGDGTLDTPYLINSTVGARDLYPRTLPVSYDGPVVFSGGDTVCSKGDELVFEASMSRYSEGFSSFVWEIEGHGQSVILEGPVVAHRFDEPGVHRVLLRAQGKDGRTAEHRSSVVVLPIKETTEGKDLGVFIALSLLIPLFSAAILTAVHRYGMQGR